MKLTLVAKRPETADVVSFMFRSDVPLSWDAGQFLSEAATRTACGPLPRHLQ